MPHPFDHADGPDADGIIPAGTAPARRLRIAEDYPAAVLRLSTRYGWPMEDIAADLDAYMAAGCTVAEAAARIQEAGEACR